MFSPEVDLEYTCKKSDLILLHLKAFGIYDWFSGWFLIWTVAAKMFFSNEIIQVVWKQNEQIGH